MKKKPLISVIITYYKKKLFISKTLKSILNQTYKNYELIFVYDDTDKTDDNTDSVDKNEESAWWVKNFPTMCLVFIGLLGASMAYYSKKKSDDKKDNEQSEEPLLDNDDDKNINNA